MGEQRERVVVSDMKDQREAMQKAEEARKNAWKLERQQREEQKKREEAERLARLNSEGPAPRKLGGGA